MIAYVASPFFTPEQVAQVESIVAALDAAGIRSYSPMRDAGVLAPNASREERSRVVEANREAIEDADLVVCNTTGRDLGTVWEAGYACAIFVPVVYLALGLRGPFNVMLAETGIATFTTVEDLARFLRRVGRDGGISTSSGPGYAGEIE